MFLIATKYVVEFYSGKIIAAFFLKKFKEKVEFLKRRLLFRTVLLKIMARLVEGEGWFLLPTFRRCRLQCVLLRISLSEYKNANCECSKV